MFPWGSMWSRKNSRRGQAHWSCRKKLCRGPATETVTQVLATDKFPKLNLYLILRSKGEIKNKDYFVQHIFLSNTYLWVHLCIHRWYVYVDLQIHYILLYFRTSSCTYSTLTLFEVSLIIMLSWRVCCIFFVA